MEDDTHNTIKEDHERNIIYFTNNSEKDKKNDTYGEHDNSSKIEPAKYVTPIVISIFIYSLFVWLTHAGFTEILDLEVPVLVVLNLVLIESIFQGYAKFTYPLYIIFGCIIYYLGHSSYALLIIISLIGVIFSRCLEKIYYNQKDYPNCNEDEFKILSFLGRVKYHILLSLSLFIIFLCLGYFYPGVVQPLVMPSVENLHNGVQEGTVQLETISLFINNFSVASNIILGGFYFSTYTLYLLIFNAIYIGFSAAITNLEYFLAYTLPHGIIELSAIILAGASGLRITHAILVLLNGIKLNEENKQEILAKAGNNFIKMLMDAVMLIVIIIVMLAIAAYIEANLTITIGNYLYL